MLLIFIEYFCLPLINQEKCDSSKEFQFFVESGDSETSKFFDSLKSLEIPWHYVREYSTAPAGACQHSQAEPAWQYLTWLILRCTRLVITIYIKWHIYMIGAICHLPFVIFNPNFTNLGVIFILKSVASQIS